MGRSCQLAENVNGVLRDQRLALLLQLFGRGRHQGRWHGRWPQRLDQAREELVDIDRVVASKVGRHTDHVLCITHLMMT